MKTVVVLGMHRSATSLVAKALAGEIHMGDDLLPPTWDNPHGHWENRRFVDLNDRIIKAAGGTWRAPPSIASINEVAPQFDEEIKTTLAEEGQGRDLWGWKDPRTTLTVRLYVPHLVNPHFVACFRDPREVAASLAMRSKGNFDTSPMSPQLALQVARVYNHRLVGFLSEWAL